MTGTADNSSITAMVVGEFWKLLPQPVPGIRRMKAETSRKAPRKWIRRAVLRDFQVLACEIERCGRIVWCSADKLKLDIRHAF